MSEIGRRLGHDHSVISYHLYRSKIPIRTEFFYHPEITTEYIKKLYLEGYSSVEIGEKTGLTPQTIFHRFKKAGIKSRSLKESVSLAYKRGRLKALKGIDSPSWRGGRYLNKGGYIEVNIDGICFLEHRLVWEKANRKIPEGWLIHHLNGIKTDNRLENLIAMPRNSHSPKKIVEPYIKRINELEKEISLLKGK